MSNIIRTEFLERLKSYKDKHIIKVITGVRRCGKSTLLAMFRDYLIKTGVDESQIVFLNFEDYDNYELLNPKNLHSYIKERIAKDKRTYIFFDEIQNVEDFQWIVDLLG